MSRLWRLKLIAFAVHVVFSATIIGIFMALVTQVWFPDLLFKLEDVWEGLSILVPVDAILGPLLTLILFVPGKKGLVGDLILVGVVQIAALCYGAYTIYDQRPEALVFAGDRFEVVRAAQFDRQRFDTSLFNANDLGYPQLAFALPGQTQEERNEFVLNNIQYQKMPERYRPLRDHRDELASKALDIEHVTPATDAGKQRLARFKQDFDPAKQWLFVLEGTTTMGVFIALNQDDLSIHSYLDLDPWSEYNRSKTTD